MNRCTIPMVAVTVLVAAEAYGVPTMDGQLSGDTAFYGAALSTQNTRTGFGDASQGDVAGNGNGSELDQVFGKVANGRLYVFVSGNLQTNFNKMEVFIDSKAGGVSSIDGSALPTRVDGWCCSPQGQGNGALQAAGVNSLAFDTGFGADYYLTFTGGLEHLPVPAPSRDFYALSAHYADLTQGTGGAVVAAGYQLAPQGLPNLLRFPGDYNHNGAVDAADYTVWRDTLGQTKPKGSGANASPNTTVGPEDYTIWTSNFGNDTTNAGPSYFPNPTSIASQALLGPALPGLAQGQLIDRNYALAGGGCTNDTGAGCVAKELEFALDVSPTEVGTNQSNHRNFSNTVDLQMALDNSNTVGVRGSGGPDFSLQAGVDDPQNVTTGLEFSIPLSKIGSPTGNIKLVAYIDGQVHDFDSNQFSGDGLLAGNFGTLPPDLAVEVAGNQYVTIANPGAGGGSGTVPEPSSIMLLVMGALVGGQVLRRQS